jgi:hypothetical protein
MFHQILVVAFFQIFEASFSTASINISVTHKLDAALTCQAALTESTAEAAVFYHINITY